MLTYFTLPSIELNNSKCCPALPEASPAPMWSPCIHGFCYGNLTKSGTPGWFLNKIGYLFFRDGARLPKRLQNRLLAPEPTAPSVRAAPQTVLSAFEPSKQRQCQPPKNALDGQPDLFRNTPGIPRPVLRFHKLPNFVHTAPAFGTCRPTKIRRHRCTTCRPDATALRRMVACGMAVSADTQPRSGARTKRKDKTM